MKTIILDTNLLIHSLEYHIDIDEELRNVLNEPFEVAIIKTTEKELKGKKNENLARKWLEKLHVKLINPPKDDINVDQAILAVAEQNTLVATQDKELKQKLKKKGIQVITIRQKKYFLMENVL